MTIEKGPLTDLAVTMIERRRFLEDMINRAKSFPRISRAMKLAIFGLSAELVEELAEQTNVAMRVNRDLVEAYQALREERDQLILQNQLLVQEMGNRKLFLTASTLH